MITSNADRTQLLVNRTQPAGELIGTWLQDSGSNTQVVYIDPNTGKMVIPQQVNVGAISIGNGTPLLNSGRVTQYIGEIITTASDSDVLIDPLDQSRLGLLRRAVQSHRRPDDGSVRGDGRWRGAIDSSARGGRRIFHSLHRNLVRKRRITASLVWAGLCHSPWQLAGRREHPTWRWRATFRAATSPPTMRPAATVNPDPCCTAVAAAPLMACPDPPGRVPAMQNAL